MNYISNKNSILFFTLFSLFFIGCSKEDDYFFISHSSKEDAQLEKVFNMVKDYHRDLSTKSINEPEIVVTSYEKKTYVYPISKEINMLSENEDNDSTQVDLYYITFNKGQNRGYAFVSGDERINRVYAYTESGDISDTTYIYPLACSIKAIPYTLEKDLQRHYSNASSKVGTYCSYGPLISTTWGQTAPYNMYAPEFNWTSEAENIAYERRHAAGCVNVATAQVIAYYEKFKGTMIGNRNIDFKTLKANSIITTTSSQAQIVGNFFREIISKNNSVFNSDGTTGAKLDATYTYLKGMGYSCNYSKDVNVNINTLFNNIKRGNPHITGGCRNKPKRSGHCWIWDGIKGYLNGSSFTVESIHCNWGWGGSSDGWFVNYEQPDPNMESYYDDNNQLYITEK